MPEIGRNNLLPVLRQSGTGYLLDGGPLGDIFLAQRQAPPACQPGQTIEVFVYPNADGSPTATTRRPLAQLGEVALLKVVDINDTGVFLDWGLDKDLLLPFAEQIGSPRAGQSLLVIVYQDTLGRLVASMKLDEFIADEGPELAPGTAVPAIVGNKTELGFKAVVDNHYWGLLYDSELLRPLQRGDRITAYIRKRRSDGRIDLSLHAPKRIAVGDLSSRILQQLDDNDGFLALGDKSPPQAIYRLFGESKKSFKQAIGRLYKQGLINIEAQGIRKK